MLSKEAKEEIEQEVTRIIREMVSNSNPDEKVTHRVVRPTDLRTFHRVALKELLRQTRDATTDNLPGLETQPIVNLDNLVRVLAKAIEVFGNNDKAIEWLYFQVPALDNRMPLSMLNTEEEAEQVLSVLGRIDYGVW